jgi:hypothetical protein
MSAKFCTGQSRPGEVIAQVIDAGACSCSCYLIVYHRQKPQSPFCRWPFLLVVRL